MNEDVSVEEVTVERVEEAMFIFVLNPNCDGKDRVKAAARLFTRKLSKEKEKSIENALLCLVKESGNGQVEAAELLLKRLAPARAFI